MSIDEARKEIEKIVLQDNKNINGKQATAAVAATIIYVKGRQKANYLRKWLERHGEMLKIIEIDEHANPSNKPQYFKCSFHYVNRNKLLFCALDKCCRLLDFCT